MDAYRKLQPRVPFLVLSLIFFTLSGCAFRAIKAGPTLVADYQPEVVSTIVVGEFQSNRLSEDQRQKLVREIMKVLNEEAAFSQVLDEMPLEGRNERIILLDGQVRKFKEGDKLLQWFIGFGVGASKLTAAFDLSTVGGQKIATYTAKRTYAGGAGIGGISFVSMEGLIERIGKDIAVTVSKWRRGEPVGETESGEEKATK